MTVSLLLAVFDIVHCAHCPESGTGNVLPGTGNFCLEYVHYLQIESLNLPVNLQVCLVYKCSMNSIVGCTVIELRYRLQH